jgi:hypothetical protein
VMRNVNSFAMGGHSGSIGRSRPHSGIGVLIVLRFHGYRVIRRSYTFL